jgi:hypothetical protein
MEALLRSFHGVSISRKGEGEGREEGRKGGREEGRKGGREEGRKGEGRKGRIRRKWEKEATSQRGEKTTKTKNQKKKWKEDQIAEAEREKTRERALFLWPQQNTSRLTAMA